MSQNLQAASQDNLMALQASMRYIRNPFGFNLKTSWNSEPVVFPGDGQWHGYVGPLAAHLVKHLKYAVINKLHDREVEKLRDAGQDKAVRKFHLPEGVKQKVHMAITGVADPTLSQTINDGEEDMDFSILSKEMSEITAEAHTANYAHSIAAVQAAAADQALSELNGLGEGEVGSVGGSLPMGTPVDPNAGSLPTQPVSQPQVLDVNSAPGGFAGLKELS